MTSKLDGRIDALEQKLQALRVQQQRVSTRRRAMQLRKSRREDIRRKILVGAGVLAKVEQGMLEESVLCGWLAVALTREDDRALFELSTEGS